MLEIADLKKQEFSQSKKKLCRSNLQVLPNTLENYPQNLRAKSCRMTRRGRKVNVPFNPNWPKIRHAMNPGSFGVKHEPDYKAQIEKFRKRVDSWSDEQVVTKRQLQLLMRGIFD